MSNLGEVAASPRRASPGLDGRPTALRAAAVWAAWCRLRGHAAPRPEDWTLLHEAGAGSEARVVLRLRRDGSAPLILKSRPGQPLRGLVGGARAQLRCRRRLAGLSGVGIPRVVACLPPARLLAMEEGPGRTAERLVMERPGMTMAVLRPCLRWAAALHGGTATRRADAAAWRRLARARLAEAWTHRAAVADGAAFDAMLGLAADTVARADGAGVARVPSHGDLHLGNMLVAGDRSVQAIDFDRSGTLPGREDGTRLLVHAAVLAGRVETAGMTGFLDRALGAAASEGPPLRRDALRQRILVEALVFWGESSNPRAKARPAGQRRIARAAALAALLGAG